MKPTLRFFLLNTIVVTESPLTELTFFQFFVIGHLHSMFGRGRRLWKKEESRDILNWKGYKDRGFRR